MPAQSLTITPEEARRLAVSSQLLDRAPRTADVEALMDVFRRLGCVQIDPINVVARNPLLVLWSRLGFYDPQLLDRVMWQDRLLFEYWAHAASIVLVEDFPIHQAQMLNFIGGDTDWEQRVRDWMADNEPFRRYILDEMAARGPLFAADIDDRYIQRPWSSSGWTNTRNVSTMLGLMWEQGDITVTQRNGAGFGLKKQWGLIEQHMPQWSDHEPLARPEVVREAAQRSLDALGVGTEKHISNYFIRGRYPDLESELERLLEDGRIHRVQIEGDGEVWPGDWYIHQEALPRLQEVRRSTWPARTVLLSPFDNLIADRERTESLFDFYYRSEIYTPKAKRQYGYYVMPILHGDRLIGRIDPKIDRKSKTLHVFAVHSEPGAPDSAEVATGLAATIQQLGRFLGAERIQYGEQIAPAWAAALQDGPC